MGIRKRRSSRGDVAERGAAIFEQSVKPHINGHKPTDIVAIDIASGAYAIGADPLIASRRLRKQAPDAQIWMRQVGSPYLCHFGGHAIGEKS